MEAETAQTQTQAQWPRQGQGLLRSELASHLQSQLHSLSQTALEAKEQMGDVEKRDQMSMVIGTMERERDRQKARDVEKDKARQSEREAEEAVASRMKEKMSEIEEARRRLQLR